MALAQYANLSLEQARQLDDALYIFRERTDFWGGERFSAFIQRLFQAQGKPSHTNATRPDASDYQPGFAIWNTDDAAPNYSDGTSWRDSAGNLI